MTWIIWVESESLLYFSMSFNKHLMKCYPKISLLWRSETKLFIHHRDSILKRYCLLRNMLFNNRLSHLICIVKVTIWIYSTVMRSHHCVDIKTPWDNVVTLNVVTMLISNALYCLRTMTTWVVGVFLMFYQARYF